MSQKATCEVTPNVISSPESAAGPKLSGLPSGQQIALFGQDRALVNHLAAQENKKEQKTQDTFGPNSTDLSPSANLTLSLGNRLKEQLEWVGSMEYSQTWKLKVTPAGRQYWAHIASTRRISGKDCTGWPTPMANKLSPQTREDFTPNLAAVAQMAGWPTPRSREAGDYQYSQGNHDKPTLSLTGTARLAGWVTPAARDWKDTPGMATEGINPNGTKRNRLDQLPRQVQLAGWPTPTEDNANNARGHKGTCYSDLPTTAQLAGWGTPNTMDYLPSSNLAERKKKGGCSNLKDQVTLISGPTPSGSPAKTEKPAGLVLNPNHSRWLMGYRAEWGSCGVTAMQSCRR